MTTDKTKIQNPNEALVNIMKTMADAFSVERQKEEPYKEMFKAGSSFTGLLRSLDHSCSGSVLDAFDVYVKRLGGNEKSNEAYEFFLALPYLAYKLEKHIVKNEGSTCCVDKTFFLLSEELKRITGISGFPEPEKLEQQKTNLGDQASQ